MQAMAFEWWLRPVMMQEREGEQSAVVCMLLNSRPFGGERVDVRRGDRAAVAAHLAEAGVVLHDEQDVGRAFFGAQRARARRAGYIEGPADDAGERGSGFVFFESHFDFPFETDG